MNEIFLPVLEESKKLRKGLSFYVNGNVINGYVTEIIDEKAVQVRSQKADTIIILLDRVDALEAV